MTNRWRIEMFGGFRVARQSRDDFRFATRKTAALLSYLAFYSGKSWGRETLADQFWPDHEPESARNSLRVALNALRKLFEAADEESRNDVPLLVAERSSVRLNVGVFTTDVADFESLLRTEQTASDPQTRQSALLKAVELYRGPLLPGWYEEWVGGEQTRLAEAHTSALRRLTGIFTEAKDFDRALLFARRAIQDDPLREEGHRLLIHLHALTGNVTSALAQYRDLEARLNDELGTGPSRVTRELIRQILSADRSESAVKASPVKTSGSGTPVAKPIVAPPTAPVPRPPTPRPLTKFFGREDEIQRLANLLSPAKIGCCRLITVTGIGGTGKTRLALEVANRFAQAVTSDTRSNTGFTGGVWVVPLADVTRASGLAVAVATALAPRPSLAGGGETAELNALEQIVQVLVPPESVPQPTLLVLDNFEQLVEGAPWIAELMRQVPTLSCLVTSRQRLGLTGEQEMPLSPLPTPPVPAGLNSDSSVSLNALEAYPSVRLWIDRARAVRPEFQLTARNAPAVAQLCAGLDGLPLALELAAAWARLLTPTQMVERLHSRFDLLVAAGRDISPRHRSLRAVLEETCGLLSQTAQTVFARLSVFRGGWTLDAAQTVCTSNLSGEPVTAGEMLETLALLQDRSLLAAVDGTQQVRFQMLETVREFAATRLSSDGTEQCRAAHARHFAALARDAAPHLNRYDAEKWMAILDEEQDNLQAALEFAETHDGEANTLKLPLVMPFAADLWRFWYARGRVEQGLAILEKLSEASSTPLNVRAVYEGAGRLALALGQASLACRFLQDGLTVVQSFSKPDQIQAVVPIATNLALAARAAGDEQTARAAYQAVLEQKQQSGDLWGAACASIEIGTRLLHLQDKDGARAAFIAGHPLCTLMGDEWGAEECRAGEADADDCSYQSLPRADALARSYLTLGHVACEQEDFPVALPLLEEARAGFLRSGSEGGITLSLERIGLAAIGSGDISRARRALEDARARRTFSAPEKGSQGEAHLKWLDELLGRAA